jgi:RHS repeat-associated protein
MQYDGLDRLTRYAMNGRDWRYWYSNEQRLDTVTNPQGATQVALGYDTRGNVLSRTRGAGWVSFGYDRGDRAITVSENNALLATHRYDGLGRRTKTTKANGDQRFQIYTQGGQFVWEGDFMSSQGVASGVNYVNLNGSLIAKLVADWNLPAQRSSDGRTPKVGDVFRNVFADAGATAIVAPADGSKPQRLADVPVTHHLRYVHTDALGSPVLETNADGYEIAGTRTFYEPYGAPLTTPREGAPSYTGHQYDTSTGMLYAQQRYYDPQLGVFMSPDPMAVDTTSAFNFNRYAYANNSPYKFTDPDGRKNRPFDSKVDSPYNLQPGTEDPTCNCHSRAWHNSKGDPTDPLNQDPLATPKNWDQSPLDDMKEPGTRRLDPNEPNRKGEIVVYGVDLNNSGDFDDPNETRHSATVTQVDDEGNTLRVEGKEGPGPVSDHHPEDQLTTHGDFVEWYRKEGEQ